MRRIPCLPVLALLALSLPLSLGMAMIIQFSLPELVAQSELIVRGEVVKTECHWGSRDYEPNGRMIFTDVTIVLSDIYKGALDDSQTESRKGFLSHSPGDDSVVIETEGGVMDDVGARVEDEPEFKVGENVIVFLSSLNPRGQRTVTNSINGKYTAVEGMVVEKDEPVDEFVGRVSQAIRDAEGGER